MDDVERRLSLVSFNSNIEKKQKGNESNPLTLAYQRSNPKMDTLAVPLLANALTSHQSLINHWEESSYLPTSLEEIKKGLIDNILSRLKIKTLTPYGKRK